MIEFDHVSFEYAEATTINDVSFRLVAGDFVALIGANGAGKSTISKLCNGLLKPSHGRVLLDGDDTRSLRTSALARKVGFLFQNPDRQICQNSIRAEIMFGLENVLADAAECQCRCDDVLAAFGFDGAADPFSMSRGERQRIALASLIACRPPMLILDEPTTGLDYRECMQIMEQIQALNDAGTTVLMVSHDMEIVQDFARRVLVLNQGRLLGDGPKDQIMADPALLAQAKLLPAQITALALRMGFNNVHTVDDMVAAVSATLS